MALGCLYENYRMARATRSLYVCRYDEVDISM